MATILPSRMPISRATVPAVVTIVLATDHQVEIGTGAMRRIVAWRLVSAASSVLLDADHS